MDVCGLHVVGHSVLPNPSNPAAKGLTDVQLQVSHSRESLAQKVL